jgi:hypothetical protein
VPWEGVPCRSSLERVAGVKLPWKRAAEKAHSKKLPEYKFPKKI